MCEAASKTRTKEHIMSDKTCVRVGVRVEVSLRSEKASANFLTKYCGKREETEDTSTQQNILRLQNKMSGLGSDAQNELKGGVLRPQFTVSIDFDHRI